MMASPLRRAPINWSLSTMKWDQVVKPPRTPVESKGFAQAAFNRRAASSVMSAPSPKAPIMLIMKVTHGKSGGVGGAR